MQGYSCWQTKCLIGTFWLTDRDVGAKPLNRDYLGENGSYGKPNQMIGKKYNVQKISPKVRNLFFVLSGAEIKAKQN